MLMNGPFIAKFRFDSTENELSAVGLLMILAELHHWLKLFDGPGGPRGYVATRIRGPGHPVPRAAQAVADRVRK